MEDHKDRSPDLPIWELYRDKKVRNVGNKKAGYG